MYTFTTVQVIGIVGLAILACEGLAFFVWLRWTKRQKDKLALAEARAFYVARAAAIESGADGAKYDAMLRKPTPDMHRNAARFDRHFERTTAAAKPVDADATAPA